MRYRKLFEQENETLGLYLRHARKRSRLSQVELAAKLDVPQSFVSKYERNERRLEFMEFVMVCRRIGIDPVAALNELLTSDPATFQRD